MRLLRFTFGIRFKLVAAFILAITLPIGALAGFYIISIDNVTKNSPAKMMTPPFGREVAGMVESEYLKTGALKDAAQALKSVELPPGARIEVLDLEGRVVFDTLGASEGAKVSYPELTRLITLPSNNVPKEHLQDMKYHVGAPIVAGGSDIGLVLVSYPVNVVLDPLMKSLKLTGLVGAGVALLVIFLLGWLLAKGIILPLKNLVVATEKISQGDFKARVKVKNKDELGRLGAAFNQMVENLREARDREQVHDLSRRELVANVSHDLRTPLSSIRGYVEGLLDGVAADPVKTRRYLEVIHEKALGLERLINDLFELSQLEARQLKMDFIKVNAGEMLKDLCEKFGQDASAAWLTFNCCLYGELPFVSVDPGRIEQVLANLLQNSFKYTPPGGEVSVKAEVAGKEVLISVYDNGEGIAPEDLPHVFERLYTGERSRSRVKGGTGLGLAIAREIVQAHGGRIWAESKKKEGSTFCFTLPALPNEDGTAGSNSFECFRECSGI